MNISNVKRTVDFMTSFRSEAPPAFTAEEAHVHLVAKSRAARIDPVPFMAFSRILSAYRKVIGITNGGVRGEHRGNRRVWRWVK